MALENYDKKLARTAEENRDFLLEEQSPLSENPLARFIGGINCYGKLPTEGQKNKRRKTASDVVDHLTTFAGCTKVYTTFQVNYVGFIQNREQTFDADVDIFFRWRIQNKNQQRLIQHLHNRPHHLRREDVVMAVLRDGKIEVEGIFENEYQSSSRSYVNVPLTEQHSDTGLESEYSLDLVHEMRAMESKRSDMNFSEVFESCDMNQMLQMRETLDDWQAGLCWLPKIKIANVYEFYSVRARMIWKPPKADCQKFPYGQAVLVLDVFGTFYEKLELDNFPLDCQSFNVAIWSLRNVDQQLLCRPDSVNQTVVSLSMHKLATMEWDYLKAPPMVEYLFPPNAEVIGRKRGNLSCCYTYLSIRAARKPDYYMSRVALQTFFWSGLSCATFLMPLKAYHYDGRPSSNIALLIAQSAYNLTIDNLMPEVPYLTYLDKFNMFNLLIMMAVTVESMVMLNAAAKYEYEEERELLEQWDLYGAVIIVSTWIAGCIHFVLLGAHLRIRELIKLTLTSSEIINFTPYDTTDKSSGRWVVKAFDTARCPNVGQRFIRKPKKTCSWPCGCIWNSIVRVMICKISCFKICRSRQASIKG